MNEENRQCDLFSAASLPVLEAADERPLPPNYHLVFDEVLDVTGPQNIAHANRRAMYVLNRLEQGEAPPDDWQDTLICYRGYGGIPNAVDPRQTTGWEAEEYLRLADMLPPEDMRSIQSSTPYAFFTPPRIIRTIWDGLARLGFTGGKVLEPGMGNGLFFAAMPPDMMEASLLSGVEIDQVSGRMARQLFPRSDIYLCGLQRTAFADGAFDLVVGNVPFGQTAVHDEAFADAPYILQSIHRYFMAKSIMLTREGGLLALIVSRHFMDSKDDRVRRFMAERAKLVGAFRLPVETFRQFARTDVTSDLLIFQRTAQGEPDAAWVNTGEMQLPDTMNGGEGTAVVNQHFLDYPDMMLGKPQLGSSRHGPAFELVFQARAVYRSLGEAMGWGLPEKIYQPVDLRCPRCNGLLPLSGGCKACLVAESHAMTAVSDDVPEFAYFIGDSYGRVYQNRDGAGHLVEGAKKSIARIVSMIKIRDGARELYERLRDPEFDVRPLQQKLMWEYQLFVARYGFLNNNANRMAFRDDPDAPLLLALEQWDEKTGVAQPAAIFHNRMLHRFDPPTYVELARDALFLSLNLYGAINWGYMEGVTKRPFAELRAELEGEIFQTPHWDWQTADQYLSGDVARKLMEAKQAAAEDDYFQVNVRALEAMLPDHLAPDQITVSLGASWIPVQVVEQFLNELFIEDSQANNLDVPDHQYVYRQPERPVTARYWPEIAEWTLGDVRPHGVLARARWGTGRAHALDLAASALNGRSFAVYDTIDERRVMNEIETLLAKEKLSLIKDAFRQWAWRDADRRELMSRIYNETYNVYVPRRYDGSHLVLPGMAADAPAPRSNQKDAVWRGLQGDDMLVWHEVGYGKTFIAIALSMEMRRLRLRSKIMHVVPNNRIMQHATEAYRLYPGARLLLVNSKRMSARRRAETLARIVTGDYDIIIVTHSAFKRIPVSDETYVDFVGGWVEVLEDYLWELDEDDPDEKLSVKQIQAQKENFEAKLEARQARSRKNQDDHQFTWERLGIDMLIVDECHHFKNVWYSTKMTNLPGIGQADSDKALDMFLKTQWLTRRCACGRLLGNQDRCGCPRSEKITNTSLILMTATALDNSIAEIYTWQRYLQYGELLRRGIAHFDAWARMFGDEITLLEMKPSGDGWRQNTRFMRFNNVAELNRMFEQVADMQTDPVKLGIVLPAIQGGSPKGVEAEPGRDFNMFMGELSDRAAKLDRKKPWEDNILMIMNDAAKAATHMWLVDPEADDHPGNKIQLCANEVFRYWQEFSNVTLPGLADPQTLTQIVFCDLGTPKAGFNVYDYLRDALVQRGMPRSVIAYAHDATTDEARMKLFDRVNAGEIHVLIGSTGKMGEGVNMHRLLKVMHELTPPWTPAKIKQRLGRIQRPGNLNQEIIVNRYTTSNSIEFYKWHLLEQKAQFIRQFMEGRVSQRTVEDISMMAIGFAEMKAMSSGDPLLGQKVTIETRLTQLYLMLDQFRVQRRRLKRELSEFPQRIDDLEAQAMRLRQAVDIYKEQSANGRFHMMLGSELFTIRSEAAPVFMVLLNQEGHGRNVATLFGFPVHVQVSSFGTLALIELGPELTLRIDLSSSASGNISRLLNALDRMGDRLRVLKAETEKLQRAIPQYEQQLERPFDRLDEMRDMEQQLEAIDAQIKAKCDEERDGKNGHVPASDGQAAEPGSSAAPAVAPPTVKRKPMQATIEDLLQTYGLLEAFHACDEFHARLEMPSYMPLVIERIGQGRVSVAHYYTQNGDAIADPDVVYDVRNWVPQEITQPQVMIAGMVAGGWQPIVLEDGRFYKKLMADVESFSRMWAKNIRNQGWFSQAKVNSISHPELTPESAG